MLNSKPVATGSRESAHAAAAEAFSTRPSLTLGDSPTPVPADQAGRRRLAGAFLIQLDRIEPDPDQPRKRVPAGHIEELAASISEFGILQPITVRYVRDANCYRIITGECRFTAARQVGLSEIPCWVRSPEHDRILLEQIVENWHRLDLNAFELADSLAMIRDANELTQQELADQTGKSAGEISRLLAILDLPAKVQSIARADESGRISKRHLYTLRVFPEQKQLKLLARIQDGRCTAESLESLATASPAKGQPARQSKTFKTSQAEVRMIFQRPGVEAEDVLQALREVRRIVAEDGC